jgi:hypothetical protein
LNLNGIIRDTEQALEDYLFNGLSKIGTDIVHLNSVGLTATLLIRRRTQQQQQLPQSSLLRDNLRRRPPLAQDRRRDEEQELDLEVTGLIEFDIEPDNGEEESANIGVLEESLQGKVKSELDTLLLEDNLDQVTATAVEESLKENGDKQVLSDETTTSAGINVSTEGDVNTAQAQQNNPDDEVDNGNPDSLLAEEVIEKPSLLSIIFGFVLVGLATAGLCAYAVIFYKKRQKRLKKRQRMKESVQYKFPTAAITSTAPIMANGGSATTPRRQQQHQPTVVASTSAKTAVMSSQGDSHDADDDESDTSSYNGALGNDSEEAPGDDFGRELKLAASLDEEAWDRFQRKKDSSRGTASLGESLGVNSVDGDTYLAAATSPGTRTPSQSRSSSGGTGDRRKDPAQYYPALADALSPVEGSVMSSTSRWPRSFPYGDEEEDQDEKKGDSIDYGDRGGAYPHEQGVEWSADQNVMDDNDVDEEDEDEDNDDSWDNGPKPSNSSSFLAASRAALDRIGKNFDIYGSGSLSNNKARTTATIPLDDNDENDDDDGEDSKVTSGSHLTSDIVLEVERLSKFVKRYEQKKERRIQRQYERDVKLDRQSPSARGGRSGSAGNDYSYGDGASRDSRSLQTGSSDEGNSPRGAFPTGHSPHHHQHGRQAPSPLNEYDPDPEPDQWQPENRSSATTSASERMRMINHAKALMATHDAYTAAGAERYLIGNNSSSPQQRDNHGRGINSRQQAVEAPRPPAQFDPYNMEEEAPDPSLVLEDGMSVSDSESESWTDPSQHRQGGGVPQRLGITPFSVQKPPGGGITNHNNSNTNYTPQATYHHQKPSPVNVSRGGGGGGGSGEGVELSSLRGQEAMRNEQHVDSSYKTRGSRPHSMGSSSLSALRDNNAILDGTNSDVGVASQAPFDETRQDRPTGQTASSSWRFQPGKTPPTPTNFNKGSVQQPGQRNVGIPRRHHSMPNHPKNDKPPPENGEVGVGGAAKKFNSIRAMFERTAERQDGIFPPDQHWQFTSFKAKQQQSQPKAQQHSPR